MTEEQTLLDQLKTENSKLKKPSEVKLKISQKRALSLYGLGRFPVTLYREQWEKLIAHAGEIGEFIEEHLDELATKPAKE